MSKTSRRPGRAARVNRGVPNPHREKCTHRPRCIESPCPIAPILVTGDRTAADFLADFDPIFGHLRRQLAGDVARVRIPPKVLGVLEESGVDWRARLTAMAATRGFPTLVIEPEASA